MPAERLQKLISRAGIASRRHAEELISSGRVSVNGKTASTLGAKADPDEDHIKVDGKLLRFDQAFVYILMNKPKGVITSLRDPEGRPTVTDLLRRVNTRVFPVGRLDFETEGVLLLTNDGDLANHLMHPSSEVKKTYHAKIRGALTEAEGAKLAKGGVVVAGKKTAACQVKTLRAVGKNSWIEIVLHEGRKRQVREMLEWTGHPVSKLKRVRYAFLTVEDMPPGGWRYLVPTEVAKLKKIGYKKKRNDEPSHPHKQ